jgi:Protein of unknown function (DUF1524)
LADTIGNLTLTAYNPTLSNLGFEEKKKIYASSHYSLNDYFADCPMWGVEQIRHRANELWERAKELWPAPVHSQSTPDEELTNEPPSDRTDNKLIEAKREAIIAALSRREGVELKKAKGILYSGGDVRAACPVSRRYTRPSSSYYWYGYSVEWPSFLSQSQKSFLVLGCMDRASAYAIPNAMIEKLLGELYRTPERHWHIILEEDEKGLLHLAVPEKGWVSVSDFEFDIT